MSPGCRISSYIQQNILLPLGMTSSTYDVREVDPGRLAMGYRRQDDQWIAEPPLADGEFGSMGGLFTTINDFSRYMAFLLAAFPPRDEDEAVPSVEARRAKCSSLGVSGWLQQAESAPDTPAFYQSEGYGFGLGCGIDLLLGYSVSHGGGLPGYGTFYRSAAGSQYRVGSVCEPHLYVARASYEPSLQPAVPYWGRAQAYSASLGCPDHGSESGHQPI